MQLTSLSIAFGDSLREQWQRRPRSTLRPWAAMGAMFLLASWALTLLHLGLLIAFAILADPGMVAGLLGGAPILPWVGLVLGASFVSWITILLTRATAARVSPRNAARAILAAAIVLYLPPLAWLERDFLPYYYIVHGWQEWFALFIGYTFEHSGKGMVVAMGAFFLLMPFLAKWKTPREEATVLPGADQVGAAWRPSDGRE